MEITEITKDQLQTGNPKLYTDVMQAGAEAERLRISEIDDIQHIERGYEALVDKLRGVGADIRRVERPDHVMQGAV